MTRLPVAALIIFSLAAGLAGKLQTVAAQKPQVSTGISASGKQTSPAKRTAPAVRRSTKPIPTPTPTPTPEPTPAPTPTPTPPPPPPQVTYRDGLLTVEGLNCSLNTLLTAIRNKTGIEFEGIENANEPVAVVLGPAPEGEVITGILAGSRYDFLVIGRPDSPSVVQRVVLTPRGAPAPAVARGPQPVQPPPPPEEAEDQAPEEPQDTAAQAPQVGQPPVVQNPTGPKTPEQLLEELKKMKEQQQQGQPPSGNQAPRKPPRN